MIEPQHPALSVSRQCALIGISRSAWYGLRKEESSLNLALMKLIDARSTRGHAPPCPIRSTAHGLTCCAAG